MRWVTPGDGWDVAHRVRPGTSVTVCGIPGRFVQAGAGKALCPACYRHLVKGHDTNAKAR